MPIKVLLSSAKFLRISTTGLLIHERAALHRENSCKCGIYDLLLDVEPRLGLNLDFLGHRSEFRPGVGRFHDLRFSG
jgi:hypothetical protein